MPRTFALPLLFAIFAGQAAADPLLGLHQRVLRDLQNPWRAGNAVTIGAGVATTLLALGIEDPHEMTTDFEDSAFEGYFDAGDIFGSGEVIGISTAGILAVGLLSGSDPATSLGLDLASSLAVTSAYTWTLKIGIDRRRPSGGPHSFPSGHTALAFATAAVIDRHSGTVVSILGYGLATGTAFGRMEDNRHFLSDVMFGAALGLAVGNARPFTWLRDHLAAHPDGLAVRGTF